jgi:outer membrane protein W
LKKLLLFCAIALSATVFGQRVQKGETQLNAGIGFASDFGTPVYLGLDYGVHPDITVGVQASYASKNYNYGGYSDFKGTWFGIGANANYHFNTILKIPNNWDLYAGATLAYNSFNYKYPNGLNSDIYGGTNSGVGFAGQIGARYYFTENLGINVEFGGGTIASGGKVGISYKL